ncbi:hypothetical protein ACQE3E_19575 [Methylomonas sp. MED-D]|uniref:hypothetical protein n=1 Tax=unclassified Methylomonas TaxID=2608980 RepID=UPI0008D959F5|nr:MULTISPECIES: hypothetical protein [unclassified Methylomonas]MDT4332352.1 hypothetical protein [Methylomonas sp. MV1]NJA08144.1 hypothetical protein [Methylococcaceae bacterium WWC4]OHX37518.1 hypothetical protein BJL95_05725 [Methylomonas sp. LWB]
MKTPIFLSYPNPFNQAQQDFIERLVNYLHNNELEPRTLGVTDYDMESPLRAIRRIMMESNGIITIAFRRSKILTGVFKPGSEAEKSLGETWLTSPYSHIEPAMAFQIGLPVLILREHGVFADGILEKGILGSYMPEFNLDLPAKDYLLTDEWKQIFKKWTGYVASVVENKGNPPKLY